MSKKQPTAQAAQTRIPTVHVVVASCGPKTCIPLRVDLRMTVETLREQAKAQYQIWCQDEGIAYNPPSNLSADYDVYQCQNESGERLDSSVGDDRRREPWLEASRGGTTIREALSHLFPPVYVTMVIGKRWSERNDLVQLEAEARRKRNEQRHHFMEELKHLSDVSRDKHRSLQLFRERQAGVVSRVEEALLTAATEYRLYEAKIQQEHKLLKSGYAAWKSTVGTYQQWYEAAVQKKRMLLAVSQAAVALEGKVEAAHSDPGSRRLLASS